MKILPSSEKYDYKSLSDNEVEKIIKEEVLPYLVDKTGGNLKIYVGSDIGLYENGKYTSYANKKAAEEKADNEAEKKFYASIIKKLGFDPRGKANSSIIKPGVSFSAVKELYKHLKKFDFTLSIDHGSSKCYDIVGYYSMTKKGYLWINGDKIKTVVWY